LVWNEGIMVLVGSEGILGCRCKDLRPSCLLSLGIE